MRLAWFSPFPPVRTGVAQCSAELVDVLRRRGWTIDAYPEAGAHDFPWRHQRQPYDLIVYQFGNSSHHDYEWPYALRYPGMTVLHDTRLHHARAALLLREKRVPDYRDEFHWNHPGVPDGAAELAVAGFDSRLYYEWPMVRALVAASRLVAVHGDGALEELRDAVSGTIVRSIRLGHGEAVAPERARAARARVRARYGIADGDVLFGCFGGLTSEKRIPQILQALRAILPYAPGARLLLAGAPAAHYSAAADISALGLADRVTSTGYLEREEDLTDHLAACDASLNLRWPTARETSGPWLRALAAGRATIVLDLAHLADVPSLDPRTWTMNTQLPPPNSQGPVCVAIDVLDEDHSLRLAMRRLATDAALRGELGRAAREWWAREHTLDAMADDYERAMQEAAGRPAPRVELPAHMRDAGDRRLRDLLRPFDVEVGF
ncbi:MAG TPA: glycosyltransferase family 4 protein [Vicinamibacterales bacterium]|nr:glycosyltransferase family 4 protein [Vicinamibacterales bacterium]